MITLSSEREQSLVDALAEAFTPEDLQYKVADPLNVPAADRSEARDVKERARALVRWAAAGSRLEDLILAALDGNPSSSRLRQFAESVGLLAASSALIEVVRDALPSGGETDWLRGLGEAHRQVCGISVTTGSKWKDGRCTGFLVGEDQVMTLDIAAADLAQADVAFAFEGLTLGIHRNDPLVVSSDGICVLRLERPIARELEKGAANVAVRARGWISPAPGARPVPNNAIVIVQYTHDSVRVTADVNGLVTDDGVVLRYRTTTLAGSAGAPCFDVLWRLVGVNLGSDQSANHGRSVEAIVRALNGTGYRWDSSRGVYPFTTAKPSARVGDLDEAVRGIAGSIAESDVWSDEVDQLDLPEADRWAWIEAAAAHASFDPATLKAFGNTTAEARVALLLESKQVGARWVLDESLRKAALRRLAARHEIAAARAANPLDATDPLDVALGDLIAGKAVKPGDLRDPNALRTLLTVVDWLDGIVTGLPDRTRLLAALERATLLAPFRHLTRGFFAGREEELARLAAYCETGQDLPLFIHAPGGMGKSALLARFVLKNAERDPLNPGTWRPFVYLDFDRPELDATDLVGILLAIVRQLGPQVPMIAEDAQALVDEHMRRRRTGARAQRRPTRKRQSLADQLAPERVSPEQLETLVDEVIRMLGEISPTMPVVMIFDTLEEVQFANPDAIGPLVELVGDLNERVPQLRPILAGRISPERGVDPMALEGLPLAACEALLRHELPKKIANNAQLIARLAEIVATPTDHDELRGNPLSLRLAAEVVRREADEAARVIEELDDELKQLVNDAIVQGRLYERILGHVHDKRVEAMAHPGLALRTITWELIRDVLAGPCGLGPLDEAAARALFDALADEVALVREGRNPDQLELRPELRRIVREDLVRDVKREPQRMAIHTAAVAFYENRPELADRAEEIYHRLARGDDPDQVDKRWRSGIEQFLRDAVGELPARANAYLAQRVGGVADEEQIRVATPTEWEVYVAKRAGDLLKFGQPAKALDLLATRSERLPTSKLHYVESIARRMLPVPDLAGAEAASERAVAAARMSSNSDDLRDALEELVQVRRLHGDSVGVLRGLAELGNLGDILGDDLVLLQSSVETLEAAPAAGDREQFTQNAVRVFNRLPDELVAKAPELSRRVAAQVGGENPAMLQRVLRIVGTGRLDRAASARLHDVLHAWQMEDPDIAALVPAADKPTREMASVARYLASTREMGTETATKFANWLGSHVTPKLGR